MILNEENFENEVLKSDKPVLVDFWATWCGPCIALTPIIEKLSEEMDDVVIGKVNIEEVPSVTAQYGIGAVPTLLFFKDGKVVDRMLGLQTEAQIREKLESLKG